MENFVPLETNSKVLVPRRYFSMILNGRHSNFGLKLLTCTSKTDSGWFLVKFENSAKFTECELASQIWNSIRVIIKV